MVEKGYMHTVSGNVACVKAHGLEFRDLIICSLARTHDWKDQKWYLEVMYVGLR